MGITWLWLNLSSGDASVGPAAVFTARLWQDLAVSFVEVRGERMDPRRPSMALPLCPRHWNGGRDVLEVRVALLSSRVDGKSLNVWEEDVPYI